MSGIAPQVTSIYLRQMPPSLRNNVAAPMLYLEQSRYTPYRKWMPARVCGVGRKAVNICSCETNSESVVLLDFRRLQFLLDPPDTNAVVRKLIVCSLATVCCAWTGRIVDSTELKSASHCFRSTFLACLTGQSNMWMLVSFYYTIWKCGSTRRFGSGARQVFGSKAGLRVDLVQRQVEGGQVRRITHRNPKTPPAGDSPVCLSAWAIKIRLLWFDVLKGLMWVIRWLSFWINDLKIYLIPSEILLQ